MGIDVETESEGIIGIAVGENTRFVLHTTLPDKLILHILYLSPLLTPHTLPTHRNLQPPSKKRPIFRHINNTKSKNPSDLRNILHLKIKPLSIRSRVVV